MNADRAETILVAEDEPGMLDLVVTILTESGYDVFSAADGEEALGQFRTHQELLDLVMLDAMMPKKNGKEVYLEIRRMQPLMKVIFMSGYTGDMLGMEDRKDRCLYFLQKPVLPSAILKKIQDVLHE